MASGVRISPEPAHGAYCTPSAGEPGECNGESASFYVQRGNSGVCLYRVNSHRLARDHVEEGEIIPLSMGSSGQVLDAYSFRQGKQATNIRKAGYYLSLGERDPDVAGLSVPVLGLEGELLGCCQPVGSARSLQRNRY